jgi:hypothetical protein
LVRSQIPFPIPATITTKTPMKKTQPRTPRRPWLTRQVTVWLYLALAFLIASLVAWQVAEFLN